jgi:phosphatidylethanolamine/phosphatidyl-N-methylethanolamine N-methyltransferase
MKLTNSRNRVIYRLWSPIYDLVTGWFFSPGRRRAFNLVSPQTGESILLLGVGTGADLPFLPDITLVLGVDLSLEMLSQARAKCRGTNLVMGDVQFLPVADGKFDILVLNLVLSVVPDGSLCLNEGLRALRSGGRAVVFDKFAPEGHGISPIRWLINIITTLFGTDITRRFGDIVRGHEHLIIHNEPSILGGTYRVILLQR